MRFTIMLIVNLLYVQAAHCAVVEYTNKPTWQGAAGNYSTITFTELPVNTLITNQYSNLGVLFTDNSDYIFQNQAFVNDGYGLNGALDFTTLHFTQPMYSIAADFPGSLDFRLYYLGNLIFQSTHFGNGGPGWFAGLVSDNPFDKVVIFDSGLFIDDLHFGPAIPAPGALALAAIAGAFSSRRRRRT